MRVEWVVAAARVLVATGALATTIIDPPQITAEVSPANLLVWYLAFSLAILVLVWAPTRFDRGWAIGLHLCDLGVFAVLMALTDRGTGPFLFWLTFLLVCAFLRWQVRGMLWTAAGAAAAYIVPIVYAGLSSDGVWPSAGPHAVHGVYLFVVTALLTYLSSHHHQFHGDVTSLAAWPRTVSRDPRAVVSDALARAAATLGAPRALLVWDDPEKGHVNLALLDGHDVAWVHEPEGTYGATVLPAMQGRAFQTADAGADRRVITLAPRGFLRRKCQPVDERLRARFNMHAVQSWPLDGEIVRGRLFCLDKRRMRLDDLLVGEFVARLVTSRLDSLYLLERLRDAAALEERVRVARDLHDGLLQSQAGAALQLLAARRLLDRDPGVARQRLDEVQQQLERGELEMRTFIRSLRPLARGGRDEPSHSFGDRLLDLGHRMERQWDLRVDFHLDAEVNAVPSDVAEHVYRLVQEAVVNAGRHADASAVRVDLSIVDGWGEPPPGDSSVHELERLQRVQRLRLRITDDGKGFPFSGTYDLAALEQMARGPATLQERVAELHGDLTLTSSAETGTTLLITVPLAPA